VRDDNHPVRSKIAASRRPVVNRLLAVLPRRDRERLLAACVTVDLTVGDVLCGRGEPVGHAYFPLDGFVLMSLTVDDHANLGLDLVGNEGMFGIPLALGVPASPLRAAVQGPGSALRISPASLRHELQRSAALRNTLSRYIYISLAQLAQTASCNSFHALDARLVRWLLMTHDRSQSDELHLTHEFLAQVLGVRRVGVTNAAGTLQRRNLVSYRRGNIRVLDRSGLEAASCSCYRTARNAYQRVLGKAPPIAQDSS
jgi:CRP-like cAMP-binding protein